MHRHRIRQAQAEGVRGGEAVTERPASTSGSTSDALDPETLRADAERLLAANADDPARLVVGLLREVRLNFRVQESIREGYAASNRLERWLHECALADQIQNVANAIRRETGQPPAGNAHLTYDGGLRRAYRIASGVAAAFRMGIVPLEGEATGGSDG